MSSTLYNSCTKAVPQVSSGAVTLTCFWTSRTKFGWVSFLALIFLVGCMRYPPAPAPVPAPVKPEWTSVGSGAVHDEKGPVFQGVGTAENISQGTLLRASADNRASAQLAGLLEQYLTDLIQFAGYRDLPSEAGQAIGGIVRQGLDQSVISEHWMDEESKKLYSRCILELGALKKLLSSAAVDDNMRARMIERADHVFEDFVSRSQ